MLLVRLGTYRVAVFRNEDMCNSDLPCEFPASTTRRHQSLANAADYNPSGIQSKAASQAGGALIALHSQAECAAVSLVFSLFPGQDELYDSGQMSCMHRLHAGRQWEVNSNESGLLGWTGQVDVCISTLYTHTTICSNPTMSGQFACT